MTKVWHVLPACAGALAQAFLTCSEIPKFVEAQTVLYDVLTVAKSVLSKSTIGPLPGVRVSLQLHPE